MIISNALSSSLVPSLVGANSYSVPVFKPQTFEGLDLWPDSLFDIWTSKPKLNVLLGTDGMIDQYQSKYSSETVSTDIPIAQNESLISVHPLAGLITGALLLGTAYQTGKALQLAAKLKQGNLLDYRRTVTSMWKVLSTKPEFIPMYILMVGAFGIGHNYQTQGLYGWFAACMSLPYLCSAMFMRAALGLSLEGHSSLDSAIDQLKTLRDSPRKRTNYQKLIVNINAYLALGNLKQDKTLRQQAIQVRRLIRDIKRLNEDLSTSATHIRMIEAVADDLNELETWLSENL